MNVNVREQYIKRDHSMKKVTCIMVCRLRYFCILVYLMHDTSIQLVAVQAPCSALMSGELRKSNSGCF